MNFLKKRYFYGFLIILFFLYSYLIFSSFHTASKHYNNKLLKFVFSVAEQLHSDRTPISSSKNRANLYSVLKFFRTSEMPVVFYSQNSELSIKFPSKLQKSAQKCIEKLKNNVDVNQVFTSKIACYSSVKRDFFMVVALKSSKTTFWFCYKCWFFSLIPFFLIIFIIYIDFKHYNFIKTTSETIRKIARGEIVLQSSKDNELMSSLAVMSAVLTEKQERLKENLQLIEKQKNQIQQNQKIILSKEKLATVGFFAAGIAHELGNPIAALSGFFDLLEDGSVKSEDLTKLLELMKEELASMDKLIRKLLEFSGVKNDETIQMDIYEIIEKSINLITIQKTFKTMKFINKIKKPLLVKGSDQITQVFVNLFVNSSHATGGEGIVIIDKIEETENKLILSICDDGHGIKEEVKEHIFEPFFTTKSPDKGTGLGLAICKMIMNETGGDIEIGSSKQGSCFLLTFKK